MRFALRAGLVWLAAAGLFAGLGAAWIVSNAGSGRPVVPDVPLALPVAILVGWSFIGSGVLSRQPGQPNRLGLVLVFTVSRGSPACCPMHMTPCCTRSGSGLPLLLRGFSVPDPVVPVRPVAGQARPRADGCHDRAGHGHQPGRAAVCRLANALPDRPGEPAGSGPCGRGHDGADLWAAATGHCGLARNCRSVQAASAASMLA
jgi:hypothetical protein